MVIHTIGFSKKNLKKFITRLKIADVKKIIDVRLNNTSQLAGYSKKEDLEYILNLVGINYEHIPDLAPTEELLKDYKNKKLTWADYEKKFKEILASRDPYKKIIASQIANICLLCSEDKADECHRRLVAEYYFGDKPDMKINHL
ncbi:MAG: DUF488 domain-containing protein [Firmicutes bacterium]|nr:DUF488 domain-containing protein [Bacillota bacterium]MCL5058640.1 DUF488 domain-containing protein [Actinomycetota bacterium]